MSDWPNNGCPPSPQGTGASQPKGPSGGGIVPAGSQGEKNAPRREASLPLALVLCAIGGLATTSSMSLLAPVLMSFGLVTAASHAGARGIALGALAGLVTTFVTGYPNGVASLAAGAIVCGASVAIAAAFLRKRLTPGALCVIVAVVAACHLGADAALAASSGTSLTESVMEVLDLVEQQLADVTPTSSAQVAGVRSAFEVLWPTAYVAIALFECLAAQVGVWFATPRGESLDRQGLAFFDLPLWVVAVLVASAAALAVALTVPDAPRGLLVASANLVMALRFAFVAQGIAVLSWFLRERHVGPLPQFLATVAALYLEVQFIVVTVVGLVDVWANFRHLQRGGRPDDEGNAQQDKEPAQVG